MLLQTARVFSCVTRRDGAEFHPTIVTRRLQSLPCCAARASFWLTSAITTVVGPKQVLTGPGFPVHEPTYPTYRWRKVPNGDG
jgi:hypothetical protein